MREIKFRAKGLVKKGWLYGSLALYSDNKYVILPNKDWADGDEVDENTIGQFTGLHDKKQKPIYEGDIVLQQGYNGKKIPMVVKFECGAFIVGYHEGSSTKRRPMLLNSQCEVIGNVFDNRDLLEE